MILTRREIYDAFTEAGSDKSVFHGYDLMYHSVLNRMEGINKLLEIGVSRGASLIAWRKLFPEAEIVGVDKKMHEEIFPDALKERIVVMDSARTAIKEQVGSGYQIIVDDGDHRPDWQWQTFLNLEGCWTDYYVIEDVFLDENEKLLRKRLDSKGYFDVETYTSKSEATIQVRGEMVTGKYYAMVIKHPG